MARKIGCPDEKLSVVHLSRDLEQFPFRQPSQPVQRLLFVGRLVPKKAPLDAIRAVEQANEQGADLNLDVVGDGPLGENARRYVEEHGLSDTVMLHGRLPNAEVAEYMRTADAFLLPSKTAPDGNQEGTPTVLVEAQAVGLPCVTTRHAGIPEMIPEANHDLLVPEGNVAALTDTLCRLSSSAVEKLQQVAKRGRWKVERDFNLSGEVKHLKEIYHEHANNKILQP
jgi:glycosyltransferase involved in cell wall biosynthesis